VICVGLVIGGRCDLVGFGDRCLIYDGAGKRLFSLRGSAGVGQGEGGKLEDDAEDADRRKMKESKCCGMKIFILLIISELEGGF